MLNAIIAAALDNATGTVTEGLKALQGNLGTLAGAVVLIAIAVFVIFIMKNLIANAVGGIVLLLVAVYVLGIPIPLNGLTIIVSILGGIGGVAALLLAAFLGWL